MKKIIVLLAVFLLAGCSTKFAYKNLDWLVHWYVDDYIELSKPQKQTFDQYVEQWQAWHMQTELPKYQQHLEQLVDDIAQQNINLERLNYHQDKARAHWHRLREHIAPGVAEMAATLDDEQIAYFFAALEKENVKDEDERKERMSRNDQERKKAWVERNFDNLNNWFGRLTNVQEDFVKNSYDNFESTSQYWLAYKRDYQQALRVEFASSLRDEIFKANMTTLISNPEKYRSSEMLASSERNEHASKYYLLSMFNMSTAKQREHLIDEINNLRDDVADLYNGR